MALYNRVRILIVGSRRHGRDSNTARAEYDPIFGPIGAYYAGLGSSPNGNSGSHLYLLDDPTDEQLANILLLTKKGMTLEIAREYRGSNPVEYSVEDIVKDISRTLAPNLFSTATATAEQMTLARCWSGVKVMEMMLAKLTQEACCKGGPQWGHTWECPTLP